MLDFADEVQRSLPKLRAPEPTRSGTLVRLVGLTLETRGIMAPLGACCEVVGQHGHRVEAEVVGFHDGLTFLMPHGETSGLRPGLRITPLPNQWSIPKISIPLPEFDAEQAHSKHLPVGDGMLGRVVDANAQPLSGSTNISPMNATAMPMMTSTMAISTKVNPFWALFLAFMVFS